jgi:hypothetical protein
MADVFDDPLKQEVWITLRALNDAWTKGNPDDLAQYFHRDMVAFTATDRHRLNGRENCLDSWRRFSNSVRIIHWTEVEPAIQVYGNSAVATYYFDMSFSAGGQIIELGGRDMFFFAKEDGRWWAVADQFSPYPGATGGE